MYGVGETFYFEINEEEFELHVIGDLMSVGKEYIVAEDLDGEKHAFMYDENEEELTYLDDLDEALEVIEEWENEYSSAGSNDIGDWDEDGYYEREDKGGASTGEDSYSEVDSDDYDDEVDSFFGNL